MELEIPRYTTDTLAMLSLWQPMFASGQSRSNAIDCGVRQARNECDGDSICFSLARLYWRDSIEALLSLAIQLKLFSLTLSLSRFPRPRLSPALPHLSEIMSTP